MYLVNVVGSASHQFDSITNFVLVLDFLAIGFWPIASYWLAVVLHFIYHWLVKINKWIGNFFSNSIKTICDFVLVYCHSIVSKIKSKLLIKLLDYFDHCHIPLFFGNYFWSNTGNDFVQHLTWHTLTDTDTGRFHIFTIFSKHLILFQILRCNRISFVIICNKISTWLC